MGWSEGTIKQGTVHTCAWKMNSGRSCRCMFHTFTRPSGSCGAEGFLVYDASTSSGNWSGQHRPNDDGVHTFGEKFISLIIRFLDHLSS